MRMIARPELLWASVAMLLALPAVAQAQYTYTTNADNTINITGHNGGSGMMTIPNWINTLPVTSIGDFAFAYFNSLTGMIIGSNVTRMGDGVLLSCPNLTNLTIPASVSTIGGNMCLSCISLPAITVDAANSAYSSVDGVLFDKTQTTLIAYPGGKTGSYTIPSGVHNINAGSFQHCINLTSVTIPASVTSIGTIAWLDCASLTGITVDAANSTYSSVDGVLFDKTQTTLIAYPGGKTGSYTIPGSVINIGDFAFDDCSGLTGVTIPNSVTSIGYCAFSGCSNLTNAIIPNSVTSIGSTAFNYCSGLTSVTISTNVTSINSLTFNGCTSLTMVTIPNRVTSIGDLAFAGCNHLTSVTIGTKVTSIGYRAFANDFCLTSVYFRGNAPTSVDSTAFEFDAYVMVYYLPGTTGWGTTLGGRPTVLWNPHVPNDANFGVQANQFGFTFTNAGNPVVVIEACTNLTTPVWSSVATNTLTGGSSYFGDPQWTNYSVRFYRIRMPW